TRCQGEALGATRIQKYSGRLGYCACAVSIYRRCRESKVKSVGKPDARNGHVRFDERGQETGRRFGVSARVWPRLYAQGTTAVPAGRASPRDVTRQRSEICTGEVTCCLQLNTDSFPQIVGSTTVDNAPLHNRRQPNYKRGMDAASRERGAGKGAVALVPASALNKPGRRSAPTEEPQAVDDPDERELVTSWRRSG